MPFFPGGSGGGGGVDSVNGQVGAVSLAGVYAPAADVDALETKVGANVLGVARHNGSSWPVRPAGFAVVLWVGPAASPPAINGTYALDGYDTFLAI